MTSNPTIEILDTITPIKYGGGTVNILVHLNGESRETNLYKKKNGQLVYWSPFTGERIKFGKDKLDIPPRRKKNWDKQGMWPDGPKRPKPVAFTRKLSKNEKRKGRKPPRKNGPALRELLYEIQDGFCHYCAKITIWECWTVDHVTPVSRGGTNHLNNKVGACKKCNNLKGSKTAEEFAGVVQMAEHGISNPEATVQFRSPAPKL